MEKLQESDNREEGLGLTEGGKEYFASHRAELRDKMDLAKENYARGITRFKESLRRSNNVLMQKLMEQNDFLQEEDPSVFYDKLNEAYYNIVNPMDIAGEELTNFVRTFLEVDGARELSGLYYAFIRASNEEWEWLKTVDKIREATESKE